jgi:DNA-binding transcriptional regulator YiaG
MKPMALAVYFSTLRMRHGLSRPQVVRRINERIGVEVDTSTVYRWERKGKRPSGPSLHALLDVLHGHMDDVKAIDADPSNTQKGEYLAEKRFTESQQQRLDTIARDASPEVEEILRQLREEARVKPDVVGLLRSLLATLRSADGVQSR